MVVDDGFFDSGSTMATMPEAVKSYTDAKNNVSELNSDANLRVTE